MTREEAIEVYNGLINLKIKEAFEFFAPELKESEDERIKKGMIVLIENWNYPQELFTTKRNIIAYLKKLKEQEHPCDSAQFEEGFKTGYELGLRKKKEPKQESGEKGVKGPQEIGDWRGEEGVCKKQKEQKQEGIEAVVHHYATVHYLETNTEQLNARLKQFDEGARVVVYIEARKEE